MIEMPVSTERPGRRTPHTFFCAEWKAEAMRKSGNGHNIDFEQFLDHIKTIVRDGEEMLKAGVSEVRQRAITSAKTTNRAVHEHPYKTLGIVFGVGVLVGILAVGKFSSEEEEEE